MAFNLYNDCISITFGELNEIKIIISEDCCELMLEELEQIDNDISCMHTPFMQSLYSILLMQSSAIKSRKLENQRYVDSRINSIHTSDSSNTRLDSAIELVEIDSINSDELDVYHDEGYKGKKESGLY